MLSIYWDFSVSYWVSFGNLCFSMNLSFSSKLCIFIKLLIAPYKDFNCNMIYSDVPLFIPYLLIYVSPLCLCLSVSLSLGSLAKGLYILLIFPKNQLLVSLNFYIMFLFSVTLISTLIFIISFLLLILDLISFAFPTFIKSKLSWLILDISAFLI